ncbi:MAG: S49 family peptidase [Pirellulales bacterium]|nr:S49 family peptidase [Pirellulales bacterium]
MPTPAYYNRAVPPLALVATAVVLLSSVCLTGCKCCTPTVNACMNMKADGHMTNEPVTPGNAGPVHPFTVPKEDAGMGGPSIAVIDVDGILLNMDMVGPSSAGENPVSLFRERLEAAAADPCTRAVVVRINSPGGGVTACDIMRHDLQEFKARTGLPVVACLMDVGASGGYFLATAADQIVAHPTTITGGIGVILNLYNLSRALQARDIAPIPIKSGENIDAGVVLQLAEGDTPQQEENAKLIAQQREYLQAIANQYHERFVDTVLRSRPMIDPTQQSLFDGRIFSGAQAVQNHLVDSLGYLDDAVATARSMAGLSMARVVLYHRCNDRARSQYSMTPNVPIQGQVLPMNLPGFERASMPTYLYLWQPEPTMERLGGH